MSTSVLDEVLRQLKLSPHSATSLTLYALVSTLEYEAAGCLFKLTKLRDLDHEGRKLAYALMELMVDERNRGDVWKQAKKRMDDLVRNG
jgi:DNA polymerase III psi subunit